ncbi:MAG: sugar kinase [Actinobacteria bacterium]|nr:MAG: sugar kinase [Actinomycetota bacterium]
MEILVVGSVALDSIQTPFGSVCEALGGSATHFSCSAGFFSSVGLVGVVGSDFPGEHETFLRRRDINLEGLERADGRTFRWRGYYEYDLNQAHSLETQLNVFEHFHPKLPPAYRQAPYVFLANIDPELQLEVLDQVSDPKLVVCDTMNFWIEHKREALVETLGRVDIALMNDSEARELCGTYSLLDSARKIRSWGPSTVILKKGEHGALMFSDATHFAAPAYPLEDIKDPTGAGDSFAGGFVGHLASTGDFSEANIRRAVIYGSVMASFNVEGFGTERLHTLREAEVARRYDEFKEITLFE